MSRDVVLAVGRGHNRRTIDTVDYGVQYSTRTSPFTWVCSSKGLRTTDSVCTVQTILARSLVYIRIRRRTPRKPAALHIYCLVSSKGLPPTTRLQPVQSMMPDTIPYSAYSILKVKAHKDIIATRVLHVPSTYAGQIGDSTIQTFSAISYNTAPQRP